MEFDQRQPVQTPSYPSQPPQYPTNSIMQPANLPQVHLGKKPSNVTCPSCGAQVVSSISHESGLGTWLIAGAICVVGLIFGCCLIPFFVDDCKDVKHYCPSCNALIGSKKLINID
ncbi:lipopolysaccharide-induced tumor necrosis factor-alpha factor [Brachionus plicatilis]|uniref:Lipopolysaccharide-induced tumor necrosis factor-alpha factor n=1 Tax=Brachionus plicatilis TaxID=10195 RepID=A0A3M7S4B5_BRAPC|nr:lipopolysaccharide-induced tumor necrosis factor-alpha factor [Brachionus plicatilis]